MLDEITERLTPATVAMASVEGEGTRAAEVTRHADRSRLVEVLAEHDEALLAAYVEDETSVSSQHFASCSRRR